MQAAKMNITVRCAHSPTIPREVPKVSLITSVVIQPTITIRRIVGKAEPKTPSDFS